MIRRVLLAAMLLASHAALADDVVAYEAEGDAAATGDDPRVAALDDAFAHAVESALADLVSGDARTAHKGEIDREIIGHARLWVKKFTVTKDETNDDRRQLVVSVRIDRDKLRARLGELGIAIQDTGAPLGTPPDAAPARPAVVLLRLATPAGARADFGAAADADMPGLSAATNVLRAAGFAVRRASASGPTANPEGELPLDDDAADAQATSAGAELALVIGVSVGPAVAMRGQPGTAALVTAHARLLDHKKPVGQGSAVTAARGDAGTSYAIDLAVASALADAVPPAPKKLAAAAAYHGDDVPLAEPGLALVRLAAKTPWRGVQDELKYLAG
ncbi:MAG TPA: hypothetical protein VLX92_26160, partial [Kofleriaceae bacterium]|nr:hypothetical protein [Kofleriaceae bacterium]